MKPLSSTTDLELLPMRFLPILCDAITIQQLPRQWSDNTGRQRQHHWQKSMWQACWRKGMTALWKYVRIRLNRLMYVVARDPYFLDWHWLQKCATIPVTNKIIRIVYYSAYKLNKRQKTEQLKIWKKNPQLQSSPIKGTLDIVVTETESLSKSFRLFAFHVYWLHLNFNLTLFPLRDHLITPCRACWKLWGWTDNSRVLMFTLTCCFCTV